MTIAAILIPVLVVALIAAYQNRRDSGVLPQGSSTAEVHHGPDAQRIRDELTLLVESSR